MASAAEQDVVLPPKVTNSGSAPTAPHIAVLLNGYQMDIRKTVPQVYQFELTFVGERTVQVQGQPQVKKQQFERGPRNDESKETRRRLIWGLFQQLLDQNRDFFGDNKKTYTYDCATLLYSINDLGMKQNMKREFVLNVDRNALEDRAKAYIRNTERIVAYLLRTETVNLSNAVQAYLRGDRSVVQFLELLSSQRMFEKAQHYAFGNRLYDQESALQLQGVPQILKSGMQKNVRFVGETLQNAMPILQLDPKKSAFFPGSDLLTFVCEFLGVNHPDVVMQSMPKYFDQMNKQIKGLVLQTTHLPENQITFANAGLTNRPANEITFQREGQTISVVQHYQSQYHVNLRFPRLPCVIQKAGPKESFYPMELVKIVQGQRVPIDKQTPKLTEQMIKQCQVMPFAMQEQITIQRDAGMLQNMNPYFQAHNVRIDPNLSKTEASMLFPPAIQYNPDRVEPTQSGAIEWKLIGGGVQNRRFTVPVEWPKLWAVVIVQNCVQMDQCQRFCEQLVNTAQRRGIGNAMLPQRVDHYSETSIDYVSEKFQFYALHRCMFVLFFADGKERAHPGDIHHVMKYCEQKYDVLTQHVGPKMTAKGVGGGGGGAMIFENIMMKTNLKMGGSNYNLVTPDVFKRAIRNNQDVFADVWMGGKRMFFGIGMSHAPPLTLYERQAGKAPAIPTVVGMAYTTGREMLRLRGTYWFQQARTTIMKAEQMRPLVDAVKNALYIYETANNDQFPDHLIVFRGGASEGEFKKVSLWEGGAFELACKEVAHERKGKFNIPAVTIIVCQRQSNYRIVPERINSRGKATEQNCQPGTVVDKGVMNAALTEFLLIPHRALQGTAQPLRCSVVHEFRPPQGPSARLPQMKLEEIEYITYALAYSHGICAMSTAVPGVLYSADELAKRGRNNWKMHTAEGSSAQVFELPPPGQGQEDAFQALDTQRSVYFSEVSEQLYPKIATKFWA
ncbi:hypothetical protein ACQ4LE_000492 [Meloidogyne hapla]|uniref:Piwi domain-containing protein n=1 Tax=Meloidogyne hapla TaxID=6305 RepID=A0A1I8B2T2_MELHA